jgi:hypothetical protein
VDSQKHSWSLFPVKEKETIDASLPADTQYAQQISPRIDYSLVNNWMKACNEDHPKCAADELQSVRIPGFRAIDCRTRDLRTIAISDSYAALSYVWAQVPEGDDSFTLAGRLPQLIEDTISVTLNLGIPFLWIDRYCIEVCGSNISFA